VNKPLAGIRVVEVAQFVFVPSCGAVLADWGAEVVKVEHAERGDPQRGMRGLGGNALPDNGVNPGLEHANRGKRSIGLALDKPEALDVLYRLVADADVFLTNYLPGPRRRLKIDIADIQAVNPNIVYARGSNTGPRGSESERGGYDLGTFWARCGGARGVTPPELGAALFQPAPAYGDTISGTMLAGGVAAALLARERTGEGSVVDISLLSAGAWTLGMAVDLSLASGAPWRPLPLGRNTAPGNPLVGSYRTADDRHIQLVMTTPTAYREDFFVRLGREDLNADARFATVEALMANSDDAAAIIATEIASRPLAFWAERFATMRGQWAIVQDSLELGHDHELRANGHVVPVAGSSGVEYELVTSPVQFDESPISLERAPTFAEQTDEILRSLGFDDDELIALKIAGAVT
jgi:crotonobetainyl-CoA:carnitine CoA-transferase CaiB-like acyl-CoA transferase